MTLTYIFHSHFVLETEKAIPIPFWEICKEGDQLALPWN